jgi:hypothetical protein
MTKKLYILATISTFTYASSATLEDRVKQLEDLVKQQQNIILELKQKETKKSIDHLAVQEDIADIDERLDMVETRSYSNKIKFGLGFKTKVENFSKTMTDASKYTDNNIWSTKVNLNMRSNITDDMKFTGRMTMYKYWADSTRHSYETFDSMQGRAPSDSSLYLERAYIDWVLNSKNSTIPTTLTIGRQPSSDGSSYKFSDDTTRKGTYSALAFDGAADGIVATFDISNYIKYENTRLRFSYGKGYQQDNTDIAPQNAYVGTDSNALKDTNIYGVFFDTSIPKYPNSLVQIGYAQAKDIVGDNRLTKDNKTLGNIDLANITIEIPSINNSNLDIFVQYAHSKTKSNGNTIYFDKNGDGIKDPDEYVGLLSTSDNPNHTVPKATYNGYAIWLGTRYNLNNDWKVGAEYNQGSKYWISLTQGARDSVNKLSTRGKASELYVINKINRYSNLRFGIVDIDYDYSASGWHVCEPKDINSLNNEKIIEKLRNIYLQFNLLY